MTSKVGEKCGQGSSSAAQQRRRSAATRAFVGTAGARVPVAFVAALPRCEICGSVVNFRGFGRRLRSGTSDATQPPCSQLQPASERGRAATSRASPQKSAKNSKKALLLFVLCAFSRGCCFIVCKRSPVWPAVWRPCGPGATGRRRRCSGGIDADLLAEDSGFCPPFRSALVDPIAPRHILAR